jgi:hypothetical protein
MEKTITEINNSSLKWETDISKLKDLTVIWKIENILQNNDDIISHFYENGFWKIASFIIENQFNTNYDNIHNLVYSLYYDLEDFFGERVYKNSSKLIDLILEFRKNNDLKEKLNNSNILFELTNELLLGNQKNKLYDFESDKANLLAKFYYDLYTKLYFKLDGLKNNK